MLKYHIQTIEVGSGGTPVISFTNVPQTYSDLYVVLSLRGDLNNPQIGHLIRLNNDSAANYSSRRLVGTGSAASSASESGSTSIYGGQAPAVTSTSSTFGNTLIYIPNYTASTTKSLSIEATREINNIATFMCLIAGAWSGTAAINEIDIVCESGNWAQYSSASLYGIKRGSDGKTEVASGGVVTTSGGYTIHTFNTSGTFVANKTLQVEYLVVGAGGGGGRGTQGDGGVGGGGNGGGGGGAGGYRSSVVGELSGGGATAESSMQLAAGQSYLVTVGAGGAGSNTWNIPGSNGSDSSFLNVVSLGGGGGTSWTGHNGVLRLGSPGGSGGGTVGYYEPAGAVALGTSGQGTSGGRPNPSGSNAGGGGGAGAAGEIFSFAQNYGRGGNGGNGITSSINGTSVARGGGGGGGPYSGAGGTFNGGSGGTGGGGAGASGYTSGNPTAGTTNSGGGGGGGRGGDNYSGGGAAGGSGIVIIRYPTPA
jgi:hypothetical protein